MKILFSRQPVCISNSNLDPIASQSFVHLVSKISEFTPLRHGSLTQHGNPYLALPWRSEQGRWSNNHHSLRCSILKHSCDHFKISGWGKFVIVYYFLLWYCRLSFLIIANLILLLILFTRYSGAWWWMTCFSPTSHCLISRDLWTSMISRRRYYEVKVLKGNWLWYSF